jgi:hypothetical protein
MIQSRTSDYGLFAPHHSFKLFRLLQVVAAITMQVPNVEAVQEFKVMTNTYDAQYGRLGGGVVNTTVKSGTSDWHGDVFEYFRNRVRSSQR